MKGWKWVIISIITSLTVLTTVSVSFAMSSACLSAYHKDNLDDKIRLYTICLENGMRRSDRAAAYTNRGVAYMAKGDLDHALSDFTQAIMFDKKWGSAYLNRARIYLIRGKADLAEADLNAVLHKRPARIRGVAYALRGSLKAERGNPEGARKDFNAAVARGKQTAGTLNTMAWFFATYPDAAYRDGKKAVKLAQRALELNDDSYDMHNTLAAAYAEAGLFEDAVREQTLAINMLRAKGGDTSELNTRLSFYKSGHPYREPKK